MIVVVQQNNRIHYKTVDHAIALLVSLVGLLQNRDFCKTTSNLLYFGNCFLVVI